jgi:hypothetical protein
MGETMLKALYSFFYRLWFAERNIYVDTGIPLPVDYGAGHLHMEIGGERNVMVTLWLVDGKVLCASAVQKMELNIDVDLLMPARGMLVMDCKDDLMLQKLELDGCSVVATSQPMPLDVLRGTGVVPAHVPRWRVLFRGIRDALRWGPHQEPKGK